MKFQEVDRVAHGVPYINPRNARKIYQFIVDNQAIRSVLELGFAHGTASCYLAAALDETGGTWTCVDREEARHLFKPSIEDLLERAGLGSNVKIVREKTGYNWFLHDAIAANSTDGVCEPQYDLVIIDGPKNWTIDGAAFFLVDKLLKKDGWVIFDDYGWTYASAERDGSSVTDGVAHRDLSDAEMTTAHIKEIFQLLVMQHPDYGNFRIHGEGDWAWAQKTGGSNRVATIEYNATYKDGFSRLLALANRIFKIREN
jgi:predicted O-methyltransferase YrrM